MLVNNAGAGGLGPTATTGADAQEALIRLNVIALTRLSIAALAGFRKAGTGTLVNIASVIAFGPSAGGASYSGSKAFVLNFTRSLQMEYADSDIRIQAILPGPIRTEFSRRRVSAIPSSPTPPTFPPKSLSMPRSAGWNRARK
jgi:short-subunit dehydrogenase